jgi:glycosyltransferase involved in cell wall biosynthesis
MRISYFNYHHDIAGMAQGAAVQIRALDRELKHLGHTVDLRFLAAYGLGEVLTSQRLKKNRWLRCYGHVPRLLVRNFLLLRRELACLQTFRPDVILAVSSYCNFSAALAARWLRLPLVLFCEAPLEYEYSLFLTQYYPYPRLGRWFEGLSVQAAEQVVCISEILKGYLMRYDVPATKFTVIPNGVDHVSIRPREADLELQTHLGLQNRLTIGFVGSFWFFASQSNFIRMAQSLCHDFPELVFLFVGGGDFAESLKNLGKKADLTPNFHFVGTLDHEMVPRYLSIMDIVLSPYRGDYLFYGSSMKLLEYMAAGKALLATALGQIKELVQDGYNGLLYESDDWEGMETKLRLLIENPELRRQLGANARHTVELGWTWEHQAKRLVEVLARAVSHL